LILVGIIVGGIEGAGEGPLDGKTVEAISFEGREVTDRGFEEGTLEGSLVELINIGDLLGTLDGLFERISEVSLKFGLARLIFLSSARSESAVSISLREMTKILECFVSEIFFTNGTALWLDSSSNLKIFISHSQ